MTSYANAKNQVRGNVNRMVGAAQETAGTVGEAMRDTMRDLPENLESMNRELTQRAYEGLDALNCLAGRVLEQGRGAMSRVEHRIEDRVRAQPLAALMIAFGLGAAIMLLARSRSD